MPGPAPDFRLPAWAGAALAIATVAVAVTLVLSIEDMIPIELFQATLGVGVTVWFGFFAYVVVRPIVRRVDARFDAVHREMIIGQSPVIDVRNGAHIQSVRPQP